MRNPNGYGCVYKASGNRRKPYIARVTVGWDDNGKQLFKSLGSFITSAEAYNALASYNADPYDIDAAKISFMQLYEQWSKEKFPKISDSMFKAYKNAYRAFKILHDHPFVLLRKHHFQMVIDECGKTYSGKNMMKILASQLSQFAMENDIIKKDYSPFIDIGDKPDPTIDRRPFTEDEIRLLYKSVHIFRYTDVILMMIFSGTRPSEILLVETENVHLDENYFIGGIKTENGKNRKIPISRFVKPFFEKYYKEAVASGSKWLITNTEGNQMKYSNFNRDKFCKIMSLLDMKHTPHDGRHSFATFMDRVGAIASCTKCIIGHAARDLIDRVYIHKDVQQDLQPEIDKLETLFDLEEMLSYIDPAYWTNEYLNPTYTSFPKELEKVV